MDDVSAVTISPSEADSDNKFMDENDGATSTRTVTDDQGQPIGNVQIELCDGCVLSAVAFTNEAGAYTFNGIEPGDYVVKETNPSDYPKNVTDGDVSDDSDLDDGLSITHTVTDDQNKPMDGVEMQLQRDKPSGVSARCQRLLRRQRRHRQQRFQQNYGESYWCHPQAW